MDREPRFWKHLSSRSLPHPWGLLALSSPSSVCRGPHPLILPLPCRTLGPPRRQPGWGRAWGSLDYHCTPSSGPLSRPWPRPRSGCCSSWGVGHAGCPQGPLWPGPCTGPSPPPRLQGLTHLSRPPGTHPDTQGLPAASLPTQAGMPCLGLLPHTPLASHRCCPPTCPAAPPSSLVLGGRGTPTSIR